MLFRAKGTEYEIGIIHQVALFVPNTDTQAPVRTSKVSVEAFNAVVTSVTPLLAGPRARWLDV